MRYVWISVVCATMAFSARTLAEGRLPEAPDAASIAVASAAIPGFDVAQAFEGADTNHDERVSFDEARAYSALVTRAQFDQYDTNRDGYIDRAEAGLPPVDPGDTDDGGCSGCGGKKVRPSHGDLFTMLLSLMGMAVMAKVGRP